MVQLSDDSPLLHGRTLGLKEAQQALRASAKSVELASETTSLYDLSGRVLSRPAVATQDVPPFLNSAVDGYAFSAGTNNHLRVVDTIVAGACVPKLPLTPGTAVRVLTGAPLPVGADTVIMDEDAELRNDQLTINPDLAPGSNARPKGEDIRALDQLYKTGDLIRTVDLARLAAGGIREAHVYRPLKIHVLSSGDELIKGQISDANRWMIQAALPESAFDLCFGDPIPDDLDACINALTDIKADLVITSGGVSIGDRDYLRQAIEQTGYIKFGG